MIESTGLAGGCGDDSRLVVVEGGLAGLDGNGDGALGKGSLELRGLILGNIFVANSFNLAIFSLSAACSCPRCILVILLFVLALATQILVGKAHISAITAVVACRAVDQLLL